MAARSSYVGKNSSVGENSAVGVIEPSCVGVARVG